MFTNILISLLIIALGFLVGYVIAEIVLYFCEKKQLSSSKEDIYDNKIWNNFIADSNNMKYIRPSGEYMGTFGYKFSYGFYSIFLFVKKGETPYTAIFSGEDCVNCVLCAFNRKKSEKLAQILINKLPEFEKNKIKRHARQD